MVYCQECSSEITDVETFCPFCGITLQAQNVANVEISDKSVSEKKSEMNPAEEINSNETENEMTSDELSGDSADEEIDMSATIAVDPSTLLEPPENKQDSGGYLNIKSLKADKEIESSDQNEESADAVSNKETSLDSSGIESSSSDDDSVVSGEVHSVKEEEIEQDGIPGPDESGIDISSDQEDIDELLSDEIDESELEAKSRNEAIEENPDIDNSNKNKELKEPIVAHNEETNDADTDAIKVVAGTLKADKIEIEEGLDDELVDEFSQTEESFEIDSKDIEADDNDKDGGEFIDSTELVDDQSVVTENPNNESAPESSEETPNLGSDSAITTAEKDTEIEKTPRDIKTADDIEIDEAVSVIDSKAQAWKKDDEILTTDALKDNSEKEVEPESQIKEIDIVESSTDENESDLSSGESSGHEEDMVSEEMPVEIDVPVTTTDQFTDLENNDAVKTADEEILNESIEVDSQSEVGQNSSGIEPVVQKSDPSEVFEEKGSEPEMDPKQDAQPEPDSEPIAVNSQTTPNIGVGDTDGSKSQKLKPLEEGVVLNDRYEIVRKIGGGGMGAVYLANDRNLGGVLRAVKEMVQSYIEEEQQVKAIQDFKRESMLLTSLDHQTIPTIYDYFYDQKEARFYLVMKYISGGDLSARLKSAPEGKLDEISVTDWALQIADVLDYLHNRTPPIVYRDLKPSNIMIDGNSDRVMLIDFGIARWINKEEKGVTAVGTMGYAPPELFSGNVEPSSDIYSLGSTMFHLMTGADPQNNPLLIFDFQKHPRPRQINPQLSDQMERILMRSVEYNAEKRFSSAAEMRNSLKEHLGNLKTGNVSYGIKETPRAVPLSDQPVFCGFCGQKIVATDMFCAFCGAKQPLAQPGVQSQEYHIPATTARLVIDGTTELDYKPFDLVKEENLVGRRDPMSNIFPEVDLSKYDPQTKISRKHARIWREGDKFLLEDLGSSNGTIYKSALISEEVKLMPKQTQILQNGDKIQVGDTTLQFMIE